MKWRSKSVKPFQAYEDRFRKKRSMEDDGHAEMLKKVVHVSMLNDMGIDLKI